METKTSNTELLQPKCFEVEKYTEEDYDDMLNEIYDDIEICGYKYTASKTFFEVDPIAYNCGFSDYQEYDDVYECPICNERHEDEEDALYCCQDEPEEDDDE